MARNKNTVWISDLFGNASLIKGFDSDNYLQDSDRAVKVMRDNVLGIAMPADCFPSEYYHTGSGKFISKTYVHLLGGDPVVTGELAELLRQFNLGKSALYPTKLFQKDRKTRIEGDFFCLNFGEHKTCILPDQSDKISRPFTPYKPGDPDIWKVAFVKDDEVAVSADALDGVDMWIDPKVRRAIFFSDPLVKALKKAKMATKFWLKKCRVISY